MTSEPGENKAFGPINFHGNGVVGDGLVEGLISGSEAALAALDEIRNLIAVIDAVGTIVQTNAAWRSGSNLRGGRTEASGCGVNYLAVCERSDAAHVGIGIRSVLEGTQPRFEFDYACFSPTEDAWWALEVCPLGEPISGAVLTHTNVTARVNAHRLHGRSLDVDPVTMLSMAPAGVPGLSQLLADAQLHQTSLAVVMISLTNLVEIEAGHGRRCRDDLIIQVVARILRFTSVTDAMIRPSANTFALFASVADAQGGLFLRDRIAQALKAAYIVGAAQISSDVEVAVVCSDQFSTIDSLLHELLGEPARQATETPSTAGDLPDDASEDDPGVNVSLVVYSLPDGYLLSSNAEARALLGMEALSAGQLHMRDLAAPSDLAHTAHALSALGSGATDSYRARRTLATPDGPVALLTSVRRLTVGSGELAVVLTIPAEPTESTQSGDDPFAAALVAGTIDANGTVLSMSVASTPMETELAAALGGTLQQATHPDEVDVVDQMVRTMQLKGNAAGSFRLPHSEHGWVVCQCQLFTVKRRVGRAADDPAVDGGDAFAFVVSAAITTKAMVDRIAKLERHIRRIGSEVQAADVEVTLPPSANREIIEALDRLELTARQRDVVERLARGQRVASIATALYISRSTVRNHLAQVYHLVGVHSQEELLIALRAT